MQGKVIEKVIRVTKSGFDVEPDVFSIHVS